MKRYLDKNIDPKIYLVVMFLGAILFFYSALYIKPIMVNIYDFLGLASHLPMTYWVGFIIVIIASIRLYIDNQIKDDFVYIISLIVVGLFLFGIPIFAEDNARYPWSYYPAGEIKEILKVNKIDKISESELGSYRSWPGNHIMSAFVINFTNINTDQLIKYMPLFWVLAVICITYYTGKVFKLSNNQCFIVSLFIISSFWTMNYYYGPQSTAYILYLLFFMSIIFIYKRKNITSIVFMILVFLATIMTHMLTSIVLISSFFLSSRIVQFLYKNRIRFLILFLTIFIAWHLYIATIMFNVGVKDFVKQITDEKVFDIFSGEKYNTGPTLLRQTIHYSRISYLVIYAISVLIAAVLYIKDKINKENRELVKICFFWLIGVLVLLVFRYGAEMDDRVYILSLLPMSFILIMTFNRKIIAVLAILLIVLNIPAHYGSESVDMVQTTDLQGSKFIAPKLGKYDSVNYYYSPLIRYYNSQFTNSKGFKQGYYNPDNTSLESSTYVVSSRQLSNYLLYVFGTDKIHDWLQTENDISALLYDNGNYRIYKNNIGN